MSSIVTDPGEIRQIVGEEVSDLIRELLPRLVREATSKPCLTQAEVRALTSWSNRKLRYLRETKQVEYVAFGRSYLYATGALLCFLDSQRVRVDADAVPSWAEAISLSQIPDQLGSE